MGKSQRFSSLIITPGPSDYSLKLFDAGGKSLVSTQRSASRSAMVTQKRELELVNKLMENPGPGRYQFFSDFGIPS